MDLSWVTSRLAVGGSVESLRDARAVQAAGVKHVIDLRVESADEVALWHQIGMEYLLDPAHHDGEPKPVEWFSRAVGYVLMHLSSHPDCKILVHCHDGVHRSPAVAYAAIRAFGDFPDDAWAEVKRARPQAQPTYRKDADRAIEALRYV